MHCLLRVCNKKLPRTRPDGVVTSVTIQTKQGWQVDKENEPTHSFVRRNEDKQMLFDHLNFLQITAQAWEQAARRD